MDSAASEDDTDAGDVWGQASKSKEKEVAKVKLIDKDELKIVTQGKTLKAYLSLMDDGHSGMLKRLLESKPLTPIEDVPDVWKELLGWADGGKHYQCNRMTSLFKDIDEKGNITYHDTGRYYCQDAESGVTYSCELEARLLDELHPITMPYYPPLGYYVFTVKEGLTDRKNGDFDTKAIMTLKCPDGTVERIDRFYAEDGNGWREIGFQEWSEREEADRHRREQEART